MGAQNDFAVSVVRKGEALITARLIQAFWFF
jgi:hypothetical protein